MVSAPMRLRRPVGGRFHEVLEERLVLSASAPTVTDVAVAGSDWSPAFIQYLDDNGLGSGGYSIPVGGIDQGVAVPWSNIDQIRVTFSEDVQVDASDLTLTGVGQTQYAVSEFDYFPETRLAVWTLASDLTADRYAITLNADGLDPIANLSGVALDGEWTNFSSVYASGDGVAGGDFKFRLNVVPGNVVDTYSGGVTDYFDLQAVADAMFTSPGDPSYNFKADIYGSGEITTTNWLYVYLNVGTSMPYGVPVGMTNDAPTTGGFDLLSIDDDTVDVAISLFDAFEDAEDSDSEMTYSIVSNSAPSLFDTVAIDQALGTLTVNTAAGVSGRAELVLSATDTQSVSVQTTLTIDVDRDNEVPSLIAWSTDLGLGQWIIEGEVSDSDDDLDDLFVSLIGISPSRVSVAENGYFYLVVLLEPGESYFVDASVSDSVSTSNTVYLEVG